MSIVSWERKLERDSRALGLGRLPSLLSAMARMGDPVRGRWLTKLVRSPLAKGAINKRGGQEFEGGRALWLVLAVSVAWSVSFQR